MRRAARIAVIGGGIGGLTAARALRQRGFEPTVYEAAPELKEIGAGVALQPNAMKALRSLDLEAPVRAVAWESEYQVVRDGRSGRVLTRTPQRGYLERRFGAGGCTVHRADLLDVLAAAVPAESVQLGARCVSVQADAAWRQCSIRGRNRDRSRRHRRSRWHPLRGARELDWSGRAAVHGQSVLAVAGACGRGEGQRFVRLHALDRAARFSHGVPRCGVANW